MLDDGMETIEDKIKKSQAMAGLVRLPFDFKIKELKRHLKTIGMSKKAINKTIKIYKEKVYTRVAEVKERMEKELLDGASK